MGVVGVQSAQKHVVDSAECSLVEWRQSSQQHALDSTMISIINIRL